MNYSGACRSGFGIFSEANMSGFGKGKGKGGGKGKGDGGGKGWSGENGGRGSSASLLEGLG